MSRTLRFPTVVVMLALLATACGDSGTDATTTTTAAASTTTATTALDEPPMIPADHEGRNQCLVCHAEGVAGAPKVPTEPDHSAFQDDRAVCAACHEAAG